jgi:hypothetical protein
MLLALGCEDVEVPRDEGPRMVGCAEAVSEDDKMLLNCLDPVSHTKICCLIIRLFCEANFYF